MRLNRLTVSVLSGLLLSVPAAYAQGTIIAKQLAGPPSEFAAMAAPDPAAAAIQSKSALLPIELNEAKAQAGQFAWSGKLPVENGRLRFLVFSGGDESWQVGLRTPSGTQQKAASIAREMSGGEFGLENARYPAQYFALDNLQSGEWRLDIDASAASTRQGYVLIEGDEHTELASYQTSKRQLTGQRIGLVAMITGTTDDDQVLMGKAAGQITRASLRVTMPDGGIETFAMFDDGAHADGAANDGTFGGDFLAKRAGQYLAQVVIEGRDRQGQSLLRTAEHVVPVLDPSIALLSTKAAARGSSVAANRIEIGVPVTTSKANQHYRAYAEVWGSDAAGKAVPVAWVGGMTTPANGQLSLALDERWVVLAGARAPFELRNLRVEDPDDFVSLVTAKRLPLSLPALRTKATRASIVVDDVMTQGPRPASIDSSAKGVGTRLLLVHGYCSGGVWPAAQFSNASTFLDTNQNRSHDQFARLIQSFGATWNSFGIVAHSQGGAAALHLYTYYWSGLDNATGNRLIQSVGTPYQGTNLAGILATLGSWFGVGCGTNNDLSYSGASSWLSGIPASRRAKVYYYTTAFRTTNWWTNDYCNFATDLVLSDPEDGTTEKAYGQLPSGNNMGHTTGQCHTSGMRDPAQYLDSGRNAVLNSNAAR